MFQGGVGSYFAIEAPIKAPSRAIDSIVAAGAGVVGAIHLAHPAFADELQYFVRTEFVAWLKRHVTDLAQYTRSESV
jgi:hypothetical protein